MNSVNGNVTESNTFLELEWTEGYVEPDYDTELAGYNSWLENEKQELAEGLPVDTEEFVSVYLDLLNLVDSGYASSLCGKEIVRRFKEILNLLEEDCEG